MLGDVVTTQELALFLNISPERVQQLVKEEVLEPCEQKREKGKGYMFDADIAVQDYIRYLQRIAAQRKPKDEDAEEAGKRKAIAEADLKEWQAEKTRLQTEALRQSLLPGKVVRFIFEDLIAVVNDEFESLPSRAKRDCAGKTINEIEAVLRRCADEARVRISETSFDVNKYMELEPVDGADADEDPPEEE